ncbi:hypothetical protein EVAR_81505_1 [Eumeta japonica]|uniref:Uncharacterized protein n=1 Tax=Eumeta variegata TaxID=151549 RepID=A0A4C1W3T9_EUMVA|nr:hypothetical protein EVAR_81505_1 [Eumeta japonica]
MSSQVERVSDEQTNKRALRSAAHDTRNPKGSHQLPLGHQKAGGHRSIRTLATQNVTSALPDSWVEIE